MARKLLFLINPISGTGDKQSVRQVIEEKCRAEEMDHSIYPTVESGDYQFLYPVIRDGQFTDIVIAGGDGTINMAVNSLRELNLPFGILPCGSGNGLAFSAGIPKNTEKALDIVFKGNTRETDAFLVNEHFACMLCGLGLDAQVAHDFAHDPNRGLNTYIRKTISGFLSAKTYPFHLSVHGKEIKTDAFFISIANSNQFGNHFTIAPQASLTDGLLDIVVMTKQNKFSVLIQALMQVGGFNKLKEFDVMNEKAAVLYFQTNELEIRNSKEAPMHIDGDPVETMKKLRIKMLGGCFRMIVP
jgi:diacylglycerol kinase (ATP)